MATTERRGSSSKMLEPRAIRKAVLRKPVGEDGLVRMTEDKLVLEEKRTQVPMKGFNVTAGVKQPFIRSKRKEKLAEERFTSEIHSVKGSSSLRGVKEKSKVVPQVSREITATAPAQRKTIEGKSLKHVSSGANQPLPEIKRKRYVVEMDEEEYENLEALRSHTCMAECQEYVPCQYKDRAALSQFKEFMERTLGR